MGESNSSLLSIDTPPINPVIANRAERTHRCPWNRRVSPKTLSLRTSPQAGAAIRPPPFADRFPFLVFNFLSPQEKGAAAAAPQKL